VAARRLLTAREQSLFDVLSSLYPNHKIFVQVALSQLIDVPENHPERTAIRNRFSQLVLDFVLCAADLTVLAVIELDDRSHERTDRKAADARKTKALADAGLRLVRIPAGGLPSKEKLRKIIDADKATDNRGGAPKIHLVEPTVRSASDWGSVRTTPSVEHDRAASRALKASALKRILVGALLVGGWFAYTEVMPVVLRLAFRPSATPRVQIALPTRSTPRIYANTPAPASTTSVPMVATPGLQDLAATRRAESQAASEQKRHRERAWLASYATPAACEHPIDWKAQVECGNLYMRAKSDFDKRWMEEHGIGPSGGPVVLDNGSIGGVRK
jgi:hypothetical protein